VIYDKLLNSMHLAARIICRFREMMPLGNTVVPKNHRDTTGPTHYHARPMKTDLLDYQLPQDLIAVAPAKPRDQARLMVIRRRTEGGSHEIEHRRVCDLPDLGVFKPGDLMLVNQTRVLPALLSGIRKNTGGKVSGLYTDSPAPGIWHVLLESRGKLLPGETITLDDAASLKLEASLGGGRWRANLVAEEDTTATLLRVGQTPLPPYIRKTRKAAGQNEVQPDDPKQYNTAYALPPEQAHSVAAPTAGLHFTPDLLNRIEALGVKRAAVELHVGMGTFAPVRCEELSQHAMHAEHLSIPKATLEAICETQASGGRIIAIGTTTVRAAESLPDDPGDLLTDYTGDTRLFIYPGSGHTFRYSDALMTNFHLPKSTLLALVASLPGMTIEQLMAYYRDAVDRGYRFYSYGDAMLIV